MARLHRFYVGNYDSCNYQGGESCLQIFASLEFVLTGQWGKYEGPGQGSIVFSDQPDYVRERRALPLACGYDGKDKLPKLGCIKQANQMRGRAHYHVELGLCYLI